jgi:long-subunit fatty acid transport protein
MITSPANVPAPRLSVATVVVGLVGLATGAAPRTAAATPLDDPHLGGIAFAGPTATDLSAIYWNPAAVGLIGGHQLMVGGSGRFTGTTVARAAIDPVTGQPGGSRGFPEAHGRGRMHPFSWPLGPGGFLAAGFSLANRFTLALGLYTPFTERTDYTAGGDDGGQPPTRYHAVSTDLQNLALVPALSVRLGGGVRIGAAPGFLFSVGHLVVDEDTALAGGAAGDCGGTPCGAENPAAAARYDVSSGLGLSDSSVSFTLGFGLHIDRPRWALGIAYLTRPLGTREGVEINGRYTLVTPAPRAGGAAICTAQTGSDCVSGHAVYDLPDALHAGFDYKLGERWLVGAALRWLNLSLHDAIRVRVVGPADGSLRAQGLEQDLVLHRGLQDVYELRLRGVVRFGGWLKLAGALRAATPSVDGEALSPAFVDGWTFEPALALRARLTGRLQLSAGYAVTLMVPVDVDRSVYDPGAQAACVAAGGDLRTEACRKRATGQARPTAAGRYRTLTHNLGLTFTATLAGAGVW